MNGLLQRDPTSRFGWKNGAHEIKQHLFFRGINWALIRCTVLNSIIFLSYVFHLAAGSSVLSWNFRTCFSPCRTLHHWKYLLSWTAKIWRCLPWIRIYSEEEDESCTDWRLIFFGYVTFFVTDTEINSINKTSTVEEEYICLEFFYLTVYIYKVRSDVKNWFLDSCSYLFNEKIWDCNTIKCLIIYLKNSLIFNDLIISIKRG